MSAPLRNSGSSPPHSEPRDDEKAEKGVATLPQSSGVLDSDGNDSSTENKASGVSLVEAFNKVLYESGRSGKILLWLLAISIALTMFAYALDQGITTTVFSTMATSTFGKHSALAAVSTAGQIIRAISKPFIGKLSDITSRPTTYVVMLVFYVIGFVVAASSSTFAAYTIGISFTSVGKSGLDLLSDIIVGDLTPLEWRGFFGAFLSVPFVITVPINGFIAEGFVDNWRWGLGMFAILVPVLLLPAIFTLYAMQRRGKKLGMVTMASSKRLRSGVDEATTAGATVKAYGKLFLDGLIDIDILGLVILGFAFSLILLPFTLAEDSEGGWSNPSMIAMIVVGFVLLIFFIVYEIYLSPRPLMTKRIIYNRTFIAAVIISTFNQMASAVRNTYFSSYVYIIKQWTTYEWTIFLGVTTIGLCLIGPFVGLIQRSTHRYKNLMLFGAAAKLVAYGLLVRGNGEMIQDTPRLVITQLMYCLASFNTVGVRVGSQASVPHEDMATLIALLTLWSTLGSSIGSAVSSAIWTSQMYKRMQLEMPDVDQATLKTIYGSIKKLRTQYEFDDPIRQGSIRAYAYVNGHIAVCALMLATVPFFVTFFMPNYYLGKQQNAVTNTGLDGRKIETSPEDGLAQEEPKPKTVFQKLVALYRK